MIVLNADKCGDDCFYLPNSARASSANMSKYRYRLSLQAEVYAGKLYHLMLLLPNLTTGADFGITSFLSGLVCMFQLGEVTSLTWRLLRGNDGGSEYVNFCGLGINSTLVKELHEGSINEVQQHRLPPDHSHIWLTVHHYSQVQVNMPVMQKMFKEAYNSRIDIMNSRQLRCNGMPYIQVKLLPSSDWAMVIKQYIHKGMAADTPAAP